MNRLSLGIAALLVGLATAAWAAIPEPAAPPAPESLACEQEPPEEVLCCKCLTEELELGGCCPCG